MPTSKLQSRTTGLSLILSFVTFAAGAAAQLRDVTQNPDIAAVPGHPGDSAGIGLSYDDEKGTSPDDHGDVLVPGSSRYIISRDPARAVRRGRQLFQRKFTVAQGPVSYTHLTLPTILLV